MDYLDEADNLKNKFKMSFDLDLYNRMATLDSQFIDTKLKELGYELISGRISRNGYIENLTTLFRMIKEHFLKVIE